MTCLSRIDAAHEFCVKIIDSIMALFRVDYSGRGELSERQQKVGVISRMETTTLSIGIAWTGASNRG
jgi:hypothetical protein